MVIKRKNIRPSGLLEVEADNTDSVDTNGFSDVLSIVGAKTAKFSGGSTMQANIGLRIGTTQIKIVGGSPAARNRSVNSSSNITNAANSIDGDSGTSANPTNLNATAVIDVDFGVIATAVPNLEFFRSVTSGTMTFNLFTSLDDISYTLNATVVLSGTGSGTLTGTSTSFRYIRIEYLPPSNPFIVDIEEIFETLLLSTADINIRSSTTIDTANGTILRNIPALPSNATTVIDDDLLLVINGGFLTLEIVSFVEPFDINLSEITTIKEEP